MLSYVFFSKIWVDNNSAYRCIFWINDTFWYEPGIGHELLVPTIKQKMPGIFVINDSTPIRNTIDELLLLDECSQQEEWLGLVLYLPL